MDNFYLGIIYACSVRQHAPNVKIMLENVLVVPRIRSWMPISINASPVEWVSYTVVYRVIKVANYFTAKLMANVSQNAKSKIANNAQASLIKHVILADRVTY